MKIKIKFLSFILAIALVFSYSLATYGAGTDIIVSVQVSVAPATAFIQDPADPPNDDACLMSWVPSVSPGVDEQEIFVYFGPTLIKSILIPDGTTGLAEIDGLAIGETYTLELVSNSGPYSSEATTALCTPASSLPAPVMDAEQPPAYITGKTNEVTWSLDPTLIAADTMCNVQADSENFPSPTSFDFESGWDVCENFETAPGSGVFAYTFDNLDYETYFYHAQVGEGIIDPPTVKSAFSNVVWQTQVAYSGGGGGGGGTTITPVCGNGIKQYGEQCDDGNITNGDGCSETCQIEPLPECGNGTVESGEQCDDGNLTDGDGCSSICETEAPSAVCGNSVVEEGETCDDGNIISGDGCSSTCDTEHAAALPAAQECGNGVVEEGETCDDGNFTNGDGCNSVCQIEFSSICGNGNVEPTEQCDDGNMTNGDGCNEFCELEATTVRFEIKGAPQYRVQQPSNPNLGLNSQFLVYKPIIDNLDAVQIRLDDFGNATYEGEIVTGTYDFGLNGEAHNTRVIRGVEITPTTETVVLDFTYANTTTLIAGDTVDNNYINGVDMSKVVQQYRMQGPEILSDFNREGYVNGIDASILISNYRKSGEAF